MKNKMYVEVMCKKCRAVYKFEVEPVGFKKFIDGVLPIQKALPQLTPGQREMLISQTCEKCFKNI